ncbi:tRNA epoxyqueuosine(34) reductase QueG [Thermoflavifilum thermophilum]|uniref:Epoxyqueuosine reductase n=1 Tax=Thermoflavifilum thermophilum TaxID=1393122 RepID=A0A1I7NLA9_9BACT|nr:tRNA epoxyqueuosine(34) reductase QueG [Thermoflavifilum thermophilum]SFV35399.1 epoxyqueuosine reductase [Thermoflavifilum thermophilum]
MNPVAARHTALVKQLSRKLGFDYCGIARAATLDEDARRLEKWLNKGYHGTMVYMERYFDLRIDPRKLVPGAQSVITLLMNYFPARKQRADSYRISKYAYGRDYHRVIKKKLKQLLKSLQEQIGKIQGRGFVDSAPVLERAWAVRSGLGWVGKNGNLITRQQGSFLFIATLITDLELVYDDPFAKDYCGTCTRCIDACPTQAILPDKIIDASRCISYYTIELKAHIYPQEAEGKWKDWIFGCDICQDVCPWNRFSRVSQEADLEPVPEILDFSTQEWEQLTEEKFVELFGHTPLKRAGWEGLQRNIRLIKKNQTNF